MKYFILNNLLSANIEKRKETNNYKFDNYTNFENERK